jgi:beta-xylosidase
MNLKYSKPLVLSVVFLGIMATFAETVQNPIIWADIPDPSIVRVDSEYYMSHTTMHMAPGVPIMKSKDLVNWRTVGYAYSTLVNNDEMNLRNGKNAYSKGSWASSIRYKDGIFYVLTFSYTTGKTHLYSTTNVESGPWKEVQFSPAYHDPSLFMDSDGRNYIVYGGSDIRIVELNSEMTALKAGGLNKILIPNAQSMVGSYIVNAEGSHIEKINGWYYVFLICWPSSGYDGRTVLVYRSRIIEGPYEGKVAHSSKGVAQGSVIQTEDGSWWGYLFQDNGSVGRCPWLMPVTWQNDWPVFNGGVSPNTINIPVKNEHGATGIVTSDDFSSSVMKLEWQWNHNPDNNNWSLTERPGYYRIKTSRTDAQVVNARNTLTQRSFGPKCSGRIAMDASGMKDGDVAGLCAFQYGYGYVGFKKSGTSLSVVMVNARNGTPTEITSTPISQSRVYLRVDMDFTNRTDKATFFYSLDSLAWIPIGNTLQMSYDLKHFVGYRFALFNYATKNVGGYADFDWFEIGSSYTDVIKITDPIDGFRLSVGTVGRGKVNCSPDTTVFKKDLKVTLSAQPEEGWVFSNWSGDATGNQNPLIVTMDAAKSITANFLTKDGKKDLIVNGTFSAGTDAWSFNKWSGSGKGSVLDGEYRITVDSVADNYYDIQVVQQGILLEKGKTYRLIYDAYASADRVLNVNIGMPEEPWTTFLGDIIDGEKEVNLTISKHTFSLDFIMEESTYENSRIEFSVGTDLPSVYIDNVSLFEIIKTDVMNSGKSSELRKVKVCQKGSFITIEINTDKTSDGFINLYDLKGRVVWKTRFNNGSGDIRKFINSEGFPEGYYVLKVKSGKTDFKSGIVLTGR